LCTRTGVKCPGYRDPSTLIFRAENEKISRKVQASETNEKRVAVRTIVDFTSDQCVWPAYEHNSPEIHITHTVEDRAIGFSLSTISSVGISAGLYRSVVEDFWVLSCDPTKNSARQAIESFVSICGQVILPLAFRNRALDAAAFTASTMYIGQVRGDVNLQRLAMAAYPTALCRFRSELTIAFESKSGQRYQKDLVMAMLLSVLLLEVSSPLARNVIRTTDKSVPYSWKILTAEL
jgi:hypothetical protein